VDPHARFAATPVNRFLGLLLVARSATRSEVELPLRPELFQEEGVVHGGILALLADTAAVYLLHPELGEHRTMTSIDFSMHFLAAGLLQQGPLRALATLLRAGRSVAVCESIVQQGDRMLAKGTFTYLLKDRAP